jgi:hypothetical protein
MLHPPSAARRLTPVHGRDCEGIEKKKEERKKRREGKMEKWKIKKKKRNELFVF